MIDHYPLTLTLTRYIHGQCYEAKVSVSECMCSITTLEDEEIIYMLAKQLARKMINELGTLRE